MLQFLKYTLATITGMILFLLIMLFVFVGIASSATKEKATEVKPNTILKLNFSTPISERSTNDPFAALMGEGSSSVGLNDILDNIRKAKSDENVKGIFLDLGVIPAGSATLEEIRNALIDFKSSGKFIYAYAEYYYNGNYFLASVADKVYLIPTGEFLFNGTSGTVTFYKGALEKLGIEMQVIRHGKFKGAVEPFFLTKLSPENREQIRAYKGSVYGHFLNSVANGRNINVNEIAAIADEMRIRSPHDADSLKLVDGLKYRDEVETEMKKKMGVDEKEKINYLTLNKYKNAPDKRKKEGDRENKIAIIYADGQIAGGQGDDNTIGSDRLAEAIQTARKDDKVKAIVLRINSPGGSALASDVIWREVNLAKDVKPVIVSMGDVAASGGYYIAAPAHVIVAEPNTITGSIGVFGLIPNAQKLLNDKLGITTDTVKFGKYSDLGNIDRPMSKDEEKIMQAFVDKTYEDFITKVGVGRNKDTAYINSIGQGRVWAAYDAQRIGLVDSIGGIDMALRIAARKANLTSYRITELPIQKNPFEKLLENFSEETKVSMMKSELGENYKYYQQLQDIINSKGVMMRIPYDIQER